MEPSGGRDPGKGRDEFLSQGSSSDSGGTGNKDGIPPTPRVFLSVQALPTHCWSKLVQVDVVGVTRYILARHVGIHQVFHQNPQCMFSASWNSSLFSESLTFTSYLQ